MDVPKLMKSFVIWGLVAALAIMTVTAIIVRDYHFIVEHPVFFAIETFVFSVLPSLVVLLMVKTRGLTLKESFYWFAILCFKFALFHVVAQMSGVYKQFFGR